VNLNAAARKSSCESEKRDGYLDPVVENNLHRKVFLRIVPFLTMGFLAAYIDRVNVGFAKLQMLDALHIGNFAFGFGAGLFFLGYIFCEVPSNIILQRVGAHVWLARILVTWGLVSALSCLINNVWLYYVSRLVLGVAEAGFMPGALYYLSQWIPESRRGRATALFMIGIPMSSVVGAPLSGWILTHLNGTKGFDGWRWLFLIEGIPPILLGVWAWLFLPRSLHSANWLSSEEKRYLAFSLHNEAHGHGRSELLAAFTDIRVWMIGLVDGAILLGLYTVAFWFPSFLRQHGISAFQEIGLITIIPNLAAVVSMILIGRSSDRHAERRWHVFVPVLIGGLALGISGYIHLGSLEMVFFIALANACLLGALPALWSLPATFLRGPAAAAGLAVACSCANIAGFFSTSLMGFALQHLHSPAIVMWLFAGCAMLSSFLVFAVGAIPQQERVSELEWRD